jgi:hypothetical protein
MNDDGALDNQQQDDQTAPATHRFYILLFYILSTIHYFSLATNSMDYSTFAPRCHSTVFIRAVSFSWICSILFFTTRFRRDVRYEHMPMIHGDSLWISTNRIRNNNRMSARHCYNHNRRRPWLSFIQAERGA